jgi:Sialic acid synthase
MSKFYLKKKIYQPYKKILTIAEIGCNHNNNFKICKKLIIHAKKSGFDAVKFQMFKADQLVEKNTKGHKLLSKYELSELWVKKITDFCKKIDILFFCSPFFLDAIKILKKYKCDVIKIASPEIKNLALIKKAFKSNIPTIISTGE